MRSMWKRLSGRRGGGSTTVQQPSPPPQPTTEGSIQDWVNAMPQIYQTQMQYAPLQAQQAVELAQQYATPMGQAYRDAQAAMYPETSALQEQLATQAGEGMQSEVPDWMKEQYRSNMASQLGEQGASGIGSDYMSRGLMEQQKGWQDYYRNLGLTVAGRQPLAAAQVPQTGQYSQNFTPQNVMGFNASTYGPYAGAYSSMYGANAQLAGQSAPWMQGMSAFGNLLQGVGSMSGFVPK